jgi:hypothetical protein
MPRYIDVQDGRTRLPVAEWTLRRHDRGLIRATYGLLAKLR